MSDNKKELKIFINHSTELLIWLVVILIIVAVSSLSFIHKSKNDENDYQIFLPDVDGLIVGSSVRMMGIEIGHIVKLKPVKDEVYVNFVITEPNVSIPHGTTATVEFSGMAGSKSLELYPPEKGDFIDKNTPLLIVNPPKRLHDAVGLLDEMYKKISAIIYSVSSFSDKLNNVNLEIDTEPSENLNNNGFNNFIEYSDKFLNDSTRKAKEIRSNIEDFSKNGKKLQ